MDLGKYIFRDIETRKFVFRLWLHDGSLRLSSIALMYCLSSSRVDGLDVLASQAEDEYNGIAKVALSPLQVSLDLKSHEIAGHLRILVILANEDSSPHPLARALIAQRGVNLVSFAFANLLQLQKSEKIDRARCSFVEAPLMVLRLLRQLSIGLHSQAMLDAIECDVLRSLACCQSVFNFMAEDTVECVRNVISDVLTFSLVFRSCILASAKSLEGIPGSELLA